MRNQTIFDPKAADLADMELEAVGGNLSRGVTAADRCHAIARLLEKVGPDPYQPVDLVDPAFVLECIGHILSVPGVDPETY